MIIICFKPFLISKYYYELISYVVQKWNFRHAFVTKFVLSDTLILIDFITNLDPRAFRCLSVIHYLNGLLIKTVKEILHQYYTWSIFVIDWIKFSILAVIKTQLLIRAVMKRQINWLYTFRLRLIYIEIALFYFYCKIVWLNSFLRIRELLCSW